MRACLIHFCDFRFSDSQNLLCLVSDMRFLQDLHIRTPSNYNITPLLDAKRVVFHTTETENGTYYFDFGLLHISETYEGFWGITIRYTNRNHNQYLYKMSCCMTPKNFLLVSSIQGTKDLEEKHYQFFAKYCKTRPNLFLVKLAKELGKILGCSKLLGIPNSGQVAYNWYNNSQDYDKFFASCEAKLITLDNLTYWEIPLCEKAIEEYPQKHRAKQRARRKIMQDFREKLQNMLMIDLQFSANNPHTQNIS
ncbi:DUF535 family protein [Helicobacter cetorum]|uniref:DUF535 family protein n=1 Tax=Helicobacter cetorum TaxID=138563 RepID=UPI0013151847|nr:DUF535 family protein [Helicobacter cetorum]